MTTDADSGLEKPARGGGKRADSRVEAGRDKVFLRMAPPPRFSAVKAVSDCRSERGSEKGGMPDRALLSTKAIPARDRLIFALDVPTPEAALDWIERLGEAVMFYKLGLEFAMSGHYFELLAELRRRQKK